MTEGGWKVNKIGSHCIKWFKNGQEAIIIYKEGNVWYGNVLGAENEVKGSSYMEVAEKVIILARECGWG